MKKKLLLIEDEAGLIMTIGDRLNASGYLLEIAPTLEESRKKLRENIFDLIILDLMLPDGDGMEFCAQLRAKKNFTPILMLTARSTTQDKVSGLKSGADDYLTKPFSMVELLARIEALLRRNATQFDTKISENLGDDADIFFGEWHLNVKSRLLQNTIKSEVHYELSTTEFRLLVYLFHHKDEVLSRDNLLDAVWGYNNETTSRTVDVHIAWLRQKLLEKDQSKHIQTIRRGGYKFTS